MKAIKQITNLNAEIIAPPSKSYTNRALLISALANGDSILSNVLISDDTKYMIEGLRNFGVKINWDNGKLRIHGMGGRLTIPKKEIFVGSAGTTMRFLSALATLSNGVVTITGDKRMQERPIQDLLSAINQMGANAITKYNNGFPPIIVNCKFLYGGNINISGGISSQFISAILMIAPYSEKGVILNIKDELTSKPYIDITVDIMKYFGICVENYDYRRFIVKKGKYLGREYFIEGDASNISYFLAAAAITKGRLRIKGINPYSVQGDIGFVDVLGKMGCEVIKLSDSIEIRGRKLRGIAIDMNSMPDTVQTLAVVSLFAEGSTSILNVKNLRVKETDRIKGLANELRKLGAVAKELSDGIVIKPKSIDRYQGCEIETYNDHRMAMSFAVAGLLIPNIKIKNPDCVNKSFPDFWERFEGMYKKSIDGWSEPLN